MGKYILIFLIAVGIICGNSLAAAADTINVDVSSIESSNDNYQSGSFPGGVEFPISHHPGVGIFDIPEEGRNTPGKYSFLKFLGMQNVYTLQQALNVGEYTDFESELSNNVMGFQIDINHLNPNTPIRFITKEPKNEIFVLMGEFNKVSKVRFETVLQRALSTGRNVLRVGGDVIFYNTQGLDQEIFMKKLDGGIGGEVLRAATSLLTAGIVNAFINGGQSKTRWLEPGWLNTFGGRLFSVKEMREAWDLYHDMYLKSGLSIKEFYTSIQRIDPYLAANFSEMNKLLNLACKQKWCLNTLLENPNNPPAKLMAQAESARKTKSSRPQIIAGHTAIRIPLAIYFDRDKYDLREDQEKNAKSFKKFAFKNGKEAVARGLIFIAGGHCDHYASEAYNWAQIGSGRAKLGADLIKQGLREIKNEKGEQCFTETQINAMVITYSGGKNNPLTDNPQLEKNTQAERVCILWLGKRQGDDRQ
ncbi:MAG: hypothetical protein U9R06_01165 [Patescibacteria group bacterium]|nr:hypothetical protein [Patescibacteria group bacterium]